ncbi:hypothetical protein ACFSGX_03895 [Sphingomonas arantia]|uniref:Uncharacterized protein n=1 Tax=Sphingomonas arantia TaxID=1460676 RepID=A0ABW4TVD9_9SPHN
MACDCPPCSHVAGPPSDPRELRVRAAMFSLAAIIGTLLAYTVTPQQLAAGAGDVIASAVR